MKFKLKPLIPYLPYGLKGKDRGMYFLLENINYVTSIPNWKYEGDKSYIASRGNCKPILRPLSDLTKEIEHNGEKFVPIETLKRLAKNRNYNCVEGDYHIKMFELQKEGIFTMKNWLQIDINNCPYWIMQKLFEWHFDVFGLIGNNLAILKHEH